MAEPRKVPFVTLSSFNSAPQTPEPGKKRRREEDGADITFGKDGGGSTAGKGSGGGGALFGNPKGGEAGECKPTLRLNLSLSEPSERGSAEFNYSELANTTHSQEKEKAACSMVPKGLAPSLDPSDPFADDEKERREVEELARKFENKYGGAGAKKKKKDRMQDLIDIGYGYDETDPFIDNSEAYDELVPASLTTKHGGFYINTGTLQFRPASDSEGEDTNTTENHFKKMKDGEERVIKKRRKKQDAGVLEEKKPRKNRVPKSGVSALNAHRPEKKKRKKLMKDSLHLANMLRRFNREKEEMRKKNLAGGLQQRPPAKLPTPNSVLVTNQSKTSGNNDCSMADLTSDPVVMSLLGTANNDILQDMMGDLDFGMLDSPHSPGQGENGSFGNKGRVSQGNSTTPPPPLPAGLPAPLAKRIEDLRAASRQFDEEGRKKFFTLDMNNILLDIELQVQEQPTDVRAAIYSHLEAFVPCNKEALLKRLKKLSLNIQDDRLRTPLLKLKLAVCSVMPEQIARYNMDCIAKVAKQQEEGERNGSDDDDEEKPGKRVMGPRKKFVWDDKLRTLLCNLVRIKLNCYELEGKNSMSLEDYLKAFMENEVKPLWPKGWMQARMLFKESTLVHGHLTGYTAKKKIVATPKAKAKETVIWTPRSTPSTAPTPSPVAKRPPLSPAEPICLDSLDDDLATPSLDSISQALAILGNAAKGLAQGESPPSPEAPKAAASLHSSPVLQQQKKNSVNSTSISTPHYLSTSTASPLSRPASVSASPQPAGRLPGLDSLSKNSPQVHRHSVLTPQRTVNVGVAKANMSAAASCPKPRPPATASPLMAPSGLLKGSSSKGNDTVLLSSPQSRPHLLQSGSPHLTSKSYTPPRPPAPVPSQPQSNFITPMHATLTKPAHSSIAPIIKLSPRAPSPAVSGSSSPALPQPPRSQAAPSMHQYTPKSPASFRPSFSGSPGAVAKPGTGSFTIPGQKTPSSSSTTSSLINSSPTNKHTAASITAASAGQRPRLGPGIPQGIKPVPQGVKPLPQGVKPVPQGNKLVPSTSSSPQITQVSTSGSSSLLGSSSSLPLGFGMLGGLVPVSLPFQFPSLLSLNSLATAGSSTTASGSTASSNAPFSTLTQNVYKSLQSGSQTALPPHLQLAFSDVGQGQGDVKRKTL